MINNKRENAEIRKRKKGNVFITCLILVTLILGSVQPAAVAEVKAASVNGETHAFYPSFATYSDQIQSYIDDVDSLSFAWSKIDASSPDVINTVKGQNGNSSFYYPSDYLKPVKYAKSIGKTIQLSIYMNGSDGATLLPYSDKREMMIQAITKSLQTDITQGEGIYYDGVVIDFEGLRNTDGSKNPIEYEGNQISTYFTQFLTDLKQELNTMGKSLYVAVNPSIYYDGYDYGSILKVADRVILMAHDYEPSGKLSKAQVQQYTGYDALNPANSMAPIQQIKRALLEMKSAASNQSDLSKVWLQLCFDSAQWKYEVTGATGWTTLDPSSLSQQNRVTPLYKAIKSRADNTDGNAQKLSYGYNKELQTPYIQYYNKSDQTWNIILYEDSNSIHAKINQAKAYGLGGISIWSLSNVPDYSDSTGLKYHLDGWDTIKNDMASYNDVESGKKVSFKDAAIEKAVRAKLYKPTGNITKTDLKEVYRLKLPTGVKSLNDVKNLPNLEYLDAGNLNISNISAIGSLKNLRVLYLQRNKITDITPVKNLTHLEILSLNGNKIVNITPLSKLTSLEKLYLKDNKISNITSLRNLKNLKELYLSGNQMKDYSPVKKLYSQLKGNCDFTLK